MGKCPYTFLKKIFSSVETPATFEAKYLRVSVTKNEELVVDVSLPARSARWLIDLIPEDVMAKIRGEGIPIDQIQTDLCSRDKLLPQSIFKLTESFRIVDVWLE